MCLTVENEKVQKQSDRSQYSHEVSPVNKKYTIEANSSITIRLAYVAINRP